LVCHPETWEFAVRRQPRLEGRETMPSTDGRIRVAVSYTDLLDLLNAMFTALDMRTPFGKAAAFLTAGYSRGRTNLYVSPEEGAIAERIYLAIAVTVGSPEDLPSVPDMVVDGLEPGERANT